MARTPREKTVIFGVTDSQSIRLLGELPECFASKGWRVHVVSTAGKARPPIKTGVIFHQIAMKRAPSLISDLISLFFWILLIAKLRPLLVSVGTPKASLLGMLAARLMRVPCRVYTLRGLRLENESGLSRQILRVTEKITASSSTHIHVVSASLRELYLKERLAAPEKLHLIGMGSSHGVDLEEFCRSKWIGWEPPEPAIRSALFEGRLILTFVGRIAHGKGIPTLVDAVTSVAFSESNFALLIVGPNEGAERSFGDFAFPVVFTGPVESVAPYLSITDILILPTEREGFPNAVLEASASEVAVISTRVTGSVDAVIDQETGMLVSPRDSRELSTAILRLMLDSGLRERLAVRGREWVAKYFDSRAVAKKILEKYEEWLEDSAISRRNQIQSIT